MAEKLIERFGQYISFTNTTIYIMQKSIFMLSEIQLSYNPVVLPSQRPQIKSSEDSYLQFLSFLDQTQLSIKEESAVLYVNRNNRIIGGYKLSSGGFSGTVVDPRLVLGIALKCLATGILLAHSHPSGCLTPSNADCELTCRLGKAAKLMDISLLDHLIITQDGYLSMADQGLF